MTAGATLTGALSDRPVAWHASNGYAVPRQVRRLHARLGKAVQAKRWGKVQALPHLLPHSCSGKA
jgi:RNA-directed DNA polymerase